MKDEFFQALSSPYRRRIIRMLRWKNMSVNEIVEQFDISQPSISRHLDILKKAGLVTAERRSNQMIYSLNMTTLQELMMYMTELIEGKEELQYD